MRPPLARAFAITVTCLACAAGLRAQPSVPSNAPQPRPALAPGADTNSAIAYYVYGANFIAKDAEAAYPGFWWNTRLDPANAEGYYARAIALNVAWIAVIRDKIEVDPGYDLNPPADIQARFDTLMTAAVQLDPFVDHRFDLLLYPRGVRTAMSHSHDPYIRGFYSYAMHDFPAAAAAWAEALQDKPGALLLRLQRAQALYHANETDSAYAQFKQVAESLEAQQRKVVSTMYQSRALILYSMGMIKVREHDYATAREDFGRALAEDLSLYMAHVRLARVDLALADSAAAVNEYGLAVDIARGDPVLRLEYAELLLALRRADEAQPLLAAAIALDPDYAAPYEALGRCEEARGHPGEARAAYLGFLAHASRSNELRPSVESRLKTLPGS